MSGLISKGVCWLVMGPVFSFAYAKDLFVVEAVGVTNLTISGSRLPALIEDAVAARGAFVSLGDSDATVTLNYAGVANAIRVDIVTPPGGFGTYTATITLPGFTRTFTGTTKADLRGQISEFLRIDSSGRGDLLKALKKIYASTPITITDGTPQSSTALLANRAFDEFGLRHARTNDERGALDRGGTLDANAFGVEVDYGQFETAGGFRGSTYTVAPTLRLGDRFGFVFSLPVRYLDIEGSSSFETGLLMGVPLQFVSEDKDSHFFWQVTPYVHAALAGSFDILQASIDIGGGFTNRFGYNFGFCTVQVANQIGYFDGIDIDRYDIGVENQILKNGIQLSFPISGGWLIETRAVRTDFLQDAAVPVYYTFGADLVYRTHGTAHWLYTFVPDDLYLGVYYDTDLKSYNAPHARGAIRWKW